MVETVPLPRAVVFDWDNTLVDSWAAIGESMNVVLRAFGREEWSPEEVKTQSNRALRDSFPEWFGAAWEKARDIYRTHYRSIHLSYLRPLDGSEALLRWLGDRQIPLFVVSNKLGALLRLEAETLDWTARFVALFGSLDAPRDKPERDPVDAALAQGQLKADDGRIWFVGDTHVDAQCAWNSGCTPVMLYNDAEAARLGIKLAFSDCHALLKALNNHAEQG